MTPKPSGWYDDPDDPTKLRYWDGILWSDRTMPKVRAGLEHVGEARPESEREHSTPAGQGPPAREYNAHWGPEQFDAHDSPRHDYRAPFLPGHTPNRDRDSVHSSAGATFASVPRRVAASVVDWIVGLFLASFVLSPFLGDSLVKLQNFQRQQMNAIQTGGQPPAVDGDMVGLISLVLGGMTLVLVLYDAVLTATVGRTIGRLIFGTRVTSVENGKVSFPRAVVRSVIKWFPAFFGLIGLPVAALVLLVGASSPKRQGLHDRAGSTQVTQVH